MTERRPSEIKVEKDNPSVFKRIWNKFVDNIAADKSPDTDNLVTKGYPDRSDEYINRVTEQNANLAPLGDKGIER